MKNKTVGLIYPRTQDASVEGFCWEFPKTSHVILVVYWHPISAISNIAIGFNV